jgi:hypothetical protein
VSALLETEKSKCDMIYNIDSTEEKNMRRGYSRQRKSPSQWGVEAGRHRRETGMDILESYYRKYPSQRTINETMGNRILYIISHLLFSVSGTPA